MKQTTEYQELKGNRKVKSSLFSKVFSDKKELLELYNAVANRNYTDPELLTINTLKNAINNTKLIMENQVRHFT